MFTTKLKSVIYSRKIRKSIGSRVVPNNINTQKFGLITDQKNLVILGNLQKDLKLAQDDFRIVSFKSDSASSVDPETLILDSKQISFKGNFRSNEIIDFASKQYDFLVCYFSEKNQYGSLLAAEIKAGVKIGNTPDVYGMYDLEIKADSTREFKDEVLKYYRILNKNN